MMMAEIDEGISFSRASGGTGRRAIWQCTNSIGSDAVNGRVPVNISYRVTPSA